MEEHLVARALSELHVAAVGVVLRLALVLPFLQKRPHFRRDAHHEVSCSLTGTRRGVGVGRRGRGEGAAASRPCIAGFPQVGVGVRAAAARAESE